MFALSSLTNLRCALVLPSSPIIISCWLGGVGRLFHFLRFYQSRLHRMYDSTSWWPFWNDVHEPMVLLTSIQTFKAASDIIINT